MLFKQYYNDFPNDMPLICACEKGNLEDVKLFITNHDVDASGMTLTDMVNTVGKNSDGHKYTALSSRDQ